MQTLTTREYLDRIEDLYRDRLKGVSLAAEVPFTETRIGDTVRALGSLYRRAASDDVPTREWRSRPAAVVLGLTAYAADAYRGDGWWPKIGEKAGIANWSNADAEAWGTAFRSACERLGLPIPQVDSNRHHLMPIIIHTGVPDYCVEGLLDEVARVADRLGTGDGAEIVNWITQHRCPPGLHQPAYDFLRFGQQFAHDIVERLLDAVDLSQRGQDLSLAQLPQRIQAQVARALAERPERAKAAPQRSRGAAGAQVTLQLEPWGDGLVLFVPPDERQSWRVTLDRATEVLEPSSSLTAAGQRPRRIVIRRPIRLVGAAPAGQSPTMLQLYDPAAPLLAFGPDGGFLPGGRALPAADVWLLYPTSSQLTLPPERVREEAELPLGWAGWRLELCSLEGLEAVGTAGGPPRPVLRRGGPKIDWPEPDPVLRDAGAPVYTSRPTVRIPEGELSLWRVALQPLGTGSAPLFRVPRTTDVDPWEDSTGPVVGRFVIAVRGPLGRGFRYPLTLAEGLHVTCTPPLREFGGRGLVPVDIEISAPDGVSVTPDHLQLDEHRPDAALHVRGAEGLDLTVTPAHRWVAYSNTTQQGERQYSPLMLAVEDLTGDDPGVLDIGGPRGEDLCLMFDARGRQQVLSPKSDQRRDRSRFDLRAVVDTARFEGVGDLFLITPARRQLVARLRPRTLFDGASVQDGILTLHHFCGRDDVTVAIWTGRAPWREPVVRPVSPAGRVELGERLTDAGPLLISVAVEDSWIPWEPPSWPELGTAVVVKQDGFPRGEDEAEARLLSFLQGETDDPGPDLARVWTLVDRASVSMLGRADLATAIAGTLRADPLKALRELVRVAPSASHVPELLIRTGLVATPIPPVDPELARAMWQLGGAAGCLGMPGLAPSDPSTPDSDSMLVTEQVCGETVVSLLEEGKDPFFGVGAFNSAVDYLEVMTVQDKRDLIRATGLVPKALLDGDQRALNAFALFDARDHQDLRPLCRAASGVLRDCLTVLRSADAELAVRSVEARRHPTIREDWRELAALSLALAACGRLASRGNRSARQVEAGARGYWGSIARRVPELAATDLPLAELLLRAEGRQPDDDGSPATR